MRNIEHIEYTYKHRKIVIYLAEKYFSKNQELLKQIQLHDLDKLFMYLFYDKKHCSSIHRQLISHHDNELEKTKLDYIEMVLDWESARYTKPDKPLNAYDTLYKYYPDMEKEILPILREMKIDETNLPMDQDVVDYVNNIGNVTLKEIKKEIKKYLELFLD